MASSSKQAFISWCLDATESTLVLALLVAWIIDLNAVNDRPTLLSESFIKNGFCLSPRFENTHLACAAFDVACGICYAIAILTGKASLSTAGGVAAYLFAHGFGHFDASKMDITADMTAELNLQETIMLAVIISIGPRRLAKALVETNKMMKPAANAMVVAIVASSVILYKVYIQRPSYSLTYINICIVLSSRAPRALIVGYRSKDDVAFRSATFYWPRVFSVIALTCAIFCEPFFCDAFVAEIGGHFVFDVLLAVDQTVELVAATMEQTTADASSEKVKIK